MEKNNRITHKYLALIISTFFLLLIVGIVILAILLPQDTHSDTDATEPTHTIGNFEAVEKPSAQDLYCLEFISYTGVYVEDGKNERVEDVAAILVENRANQFLDRATIVYDVGGEEAQFTVTGLPAGEKAWVLESNRMKIKEGMDFEFVSCVPSFKEDAVTDTELLQVSTEDNVITVKNTSDKTLNNVCLYYKNINDDGNYLGGITYMISFDTLAPDESLEKASGHYSDNSRIVRYSFQTE